MVTIAALIILARRPSEHVGILLLAGLVDVFGLVVIFKAAYEIYLVYLRCGVSLG